MLKRRLIPKLQMKKSRYGSQSRIVLVTTVQFENIFEIGDPVSQSKIYEAQVADELIFLDLDATHDNCQTRTDVVREVAEQIFMPFTVGGGVRTVEDFRRLLSNGADKVSINTAAVLQENLVSDAATIFGAQCVVVSIDYRIEKDGNARVYIHGGRTKTELDPMEWAMEVEQKGAGEILLTCIDKDGMRSGLELNISGHVIQSVNIPVILSGGCGGASHFLQGFCQTNASAISSGTYFCFKDENPMQTRSQIHNAGIPIRLLT